MEDIQQVIMTITSLDFNYVKPCFDLLQFLVITRAPQKPIDSLKQSVVPVYFLDFGDYSFHLFYTGIY